ncbi:hypothetical protein [Bacillus pumilus]|uniref:hypothetical protein n=1 Tax=Bacillus pumilus TaxID=1408 RepID=UPI003CF95C80
MAELIEFTNNYVNDMVGKAVISIDGPGQSEKDPAKILEKSSLKLLIFLVTFGKCNGIMGTQELYSKRTIKHINDLYGIGVYYQ